jgi:hypothetical protein
MERPALAFAAGPELGDAMIDWVGVMAALNCTGYAAPRARGITGKTAARPHHLLFEYCFL